MGIRFFRDIEWAAMVFERRFLGGAKEVYSTQVTRDIPLHEVRQTRISNLVVRNGTVFFPSHQVGGLKGNSASAQDVIKWCSS